MGTGGPAAQRGARPLPCELAPAPAGAAGLRRVAPGGVAGAAEANAATPGDMQNTFNRNELED
eukprot:1190779-Prorocentrum_minimum.AAC.2